LTCRASFPSVGRKPDVQREDACLRGTACRPT
jgi:hypothetical protein